MQKILIIAFAVVVIGYTIAKIYGALRCEFNKERLGQMLPEILRDRSMNSRDLHEAISLAGIKLGMPAFYRWMTYFEQQGLIVGWEEKRNLHTDLRDKWYTLAPPKADEQTIFIGHE